MSDFPFNFPDIRELANMFKDKDIFSIMFLSIAGLSLIAYPVLLILASKKYQWLFISFLISLFLFYFYRAYFIARKETRKEVKQRTEPIFKSAYTLIQKVKIENELEINNRSKEEISQQVKMVVPQKGGITDYILSDGTVIKIPPSGIVSVDPKYVSDLFKLGFKMVGGDRTNQKLTEPERQTMINQKVSEIKELFKEWIVNKYANKQIATNKKAGENVEYDFVGNAYHVKPGEVYEIIKPLEVKFEDLEEIYPKNEADKEIDQQVRERVFDILEYPDRILEVKEKYRIYIFTNSGKHPELFKKHNIKHHIKSGVSH